jgi:hypothetical protein
MKKKKVEYIDTFFIPTKKRRTRKKKSTNASRGFEPLPIARMR